ncbi:unnamed protein product [Medioppia subpectinata]|uniref:RING-type domain-containing protein n=1 Tax=Medioppia subpectinata TaxID=1979941 RepID=A0A7R9Q4I0_9ACAR|nr:unnamed protein product [Medioppia subpectinata]CAG2111467.1 unnamed protein product [Medioppia subpectinata]
MVLFNLLPFYSYIKTNEFLYVLVFILFISILVVFLKRMDALGNGSSVHLNREQMGAQSMVRLQNPFMFKICDESLRYDNYRNGVKLCITCDNSFWVFAYWAVDIEDLHYTLQEEWQPLRQQLLDHKFIANHYLFRSEPELYYETSEEIIHWVKPPTDYFSGESLGYNPRTRYPLVVLIVRNDDDDGVEVNDNDVVCMISIIHLKDSFCSTTTSLITQYLKQRSGHMFDLKQLFAPQSDVEPRSSQFCVVCQTSLVSHALLPCRHTCLCGQCLQRVDKCPVCRSPFTSYFRVRDDEFDAEDSEPEEASGTRSSTGWFTSINSKLNHWLGMN